MTMKNATLSLCLILAVTGCVVGSPGYRDYRMNGRPPGTPANAAVDPSKLCAEGMSAAEMDRSKCIVNVDMLMAWVARPHGPYACFLDGSSPWNTYGGRTFPIVNEVCDPAVRGRSVTGACRDNRSREHFRTWVSVDLGGTSGFGGQPVVVLADLGGGYWQPLFHPAVEGETVLPPGATCHIQMGRADTFTPNVRFYKNYGGEMNVVLNSEPDYTYSEFIPLDARSSGFPTSDGKYHIDESRSGLDLCQGS
jgi:hypothetical protein